MGIVVNVNLHKKDSLEYIEIDVPSYPIAISCKGNYYFRSGSTSQKLTGIELESFILRKRGATWDNVPHPLVKIEDLDQNAIQKFKELIEKNAVLDSFDDWGKRKLAYMINKEPEGYYVLFNFISGPDFPAELDRIYKITDGILRSLIVKKEN